MGGVGYKREAKSQSGPRAGRVAPHAVGIPLDAASYGARRSRKASADPADVRRLSPKSVVPQNPPVTIT